MSDETRTLAAAKAIELTHSLRDPKAATAAVSTRAAHTLCYGLAGTALLHACLGDATTAAIHWDAASRALGNAPPDGIHTGPGALATSLIIGTPYLTEPGPHHDLVRRATTWLSARAQALARHQQTSLNSWTPWAVYDAIKGLSGIGRVLLAAHAAGHQAEAEDGIRAALTTLTTMILTRQGNRPGWWLPDHAHPPTVRVPASGAATTGLAHGIAGPLALLAIAQLSGQTVHGQCDAIGTAAHWLLNWARPGPSWSPHISGTDLGTGPAPNSGNALGRRTAWCYGTPGIATALTLAAHALNSPTIRAAATTALAHIVVHPDRWDTEGGALCHGTAGILQASTRCNPCLAHTVANATLAAPSSAPGFLNGKAGAAMALADHAGLLTHPRSAAWDSILLLS